MTMQTTLPLSPLPGAAGAHLAALMFHCPANNANLTPYGCASQRTRPAEERKIGCDENCATWLEQKHKNAGAPVNGNAKTRRGTCGFCGRTNMAKARFDLCGTCGKAADKGEIVRQDSGAWVRLDALTKDQAERLLAQDTRNRQSAWDLLLKGAGCRNQEALAGRVGCVRSYITTFLRQLRQGVTPTSTYYAKLLTVAHVTTEQLLATFDYSLPADASPASSPPQPSGPAFSSAGPGGALAAQEMPNQAPPVLVPDIAAQEAMVQVLGNPEWEKQMLTGRKDLVSAILGGSVACELLGKALAETPQPATIPDGFELYSPGRVYAESPRLTIYVDGTFGFSSEAVRDLGIDKYQYAQLLYSRARGQIGIKLLHEQAEASLKIQHPHPDKRRRTLTARGFMRQYGLDLKARRLPLHVDQSGLLVASIDNAPAPGGEG